MEADMPVKGEWIRYEDQMGYLALPEHVAAALPGVVVIHDLMGLGDHVADVTRRIAAAGYAALAPDLFAVGGARPIPLRQERIDEAMSFLGRLSSSARSDRVTREAELTKLPDPERLRIGETIGRVFAFVAPGRLDGLVAPLRLAVRHLRRAQPETRGQKVACMGEELAALLACEEPELSGAAIFYGSAPLAAKLAQIRCPVIAFHGASDAQACAGIPYLADAMRRAGKPFEYHTYEGVGRGFFSDTKPNYYDVRASRDSFTRLLAFLLRTLAE
jgi:carboxymethylenebutenolidase